MFSETSPLVIGLAAVGLAMLVAVLVAVALRPGRRGAPRVDERLPAGADAALWSIVEAMPDPRNHLALTRDLSGEVRLTSSDHALAKALFAEGPITERAGHGRAGTAVAVIELREPESDAERRPRRSLPKRSAIDHATDPAKREQTAELFFAGEPQLNRF